MKKLIPILITLFLVYGCTSKEVSRESFNEQLVEKVKILEINDLKFTRLEITYEEYHKNIEGILDNSLSHMDDKSIFAYTDENDNLLQFNGIDLKGLSMDELKFHRSNIMEQSKKYNDDLFNYNNYEYTFSISDVYDPEMHGWKYVFTQGIANIKSEQNYINIVNKRYTFAEIEGKWKVINIEESIGFYNNGMKLVDNKDATVEDVMEMLKYQTANNEKVEYIMTFDPLK